MALIVEDGTGKSDAESYISVANADTYVVENLTSTLWDAATDTTKEQALRTSARYIDGTYVNRWKGTKASNTQALDWPRFDVEVDPGFFLPSTELPTNLVQAAAELAVKHVEDSSGIVPDISGPSVTEERVKVGPIETEKKYSGVKGKAKEYEVVTLLLRKFLNSNNRLERG